MTKATKAERIRNTLRATRERRKAMRPVVFQLKLQNLTRRKEALLRRAFLEAKWLYNGLVSDPEQLDVPTHKIRSVAYTGGWCFRMTA